jgi:deoxyribodipyrimidine photo-lyase
MQDPFTATRAEGLRRLAAFAPRAGAQYAAGRNHDAGPHNRTHVSLLSPYLRYRLITEREVIQCVLSQHSAQAVEKFIQEVLWRTYWKGWLEMRPSVWTRFLAERDRDRQAFADKRTLIAAETGNTGIAGFDDWARELVETGYLHNHARMWFASIWIFTLRLPWTLGADFFLRHLLDADAASNTLSWRWVAGLQTTGKTYLATAENIAKYTGGRFAPAGLARQAVALVEAPVGSAIVLPDAEIPDVTQPSLLLVTHEDMNPESLFPVDFPISVALVVADENLLWGRVGAAFVKAAAADTAARLARHLDTSVQVAQILDAPTLIAAARAAQARRILTAYAPVGPVADALKQIAPVLAHDGITLVQSRRQWDSYFWPHAQKGFFPFREKIAAGLKANAVL